MFELSGVSVTYDGITAVRDVTLRVGDNETVAVLGPSGSGKSTLLRAIAGLEPLATGRIAWDGHELATVPVHERRFGLMFQDYMLFPHRDVRGNVRFGLDMLNEPRVTADGKVDEALALVGLTGYDTRRIDQLSGGEQQRVALARALAPRPRLLMLDEPLGALDRALRTSLLDDLAALFERLELPIIYVTHDQDEAFTVADRVVVMRDGEVVAQDTPAALWAHPPDAWTARFLGFRNVADVDVETGVARTPWGEISVAPADDGAYTLIIPPDAVVPQVDGAGRIRGTVAARSFQRDHARVVVTTNAGGSLELEIRDGPDLEVGQRVSLRVDPERLILSASPAPAPRT
jgi:thiamine transport system ATP-binding protein